MAIRTVVTRGFGNGTFDGTIALVVRRGYGAQEVLRLTQITLINQVLAQAILING